MRSPLRRQRAAALGVAAVLTASLSCSDPADPVPAVESIALSLDSVAIQLRDSAFELTATPKGALGVDIDAEVTWESKNPNVVAVLPGGKSVRLIPVRSGATEIEAVSENVTATAKVVVLDTVFSISISAADTLVTLYQALQFTADVVGPLSASRDVKWSVGNAAVAEIDSSQGKNPIRIVSRDSGATTVTVTSAIDRNKSATRRFRTARPVSLYFESQPGQATAPIRAQDILIPGPIVKVRDALGNAFNGNVPVTVAVVPGSGTPNAELFGTHVVTTSSGDARFTNIGIDLPGADYRIVATSPGLLDATSSPFTVGPECAAIPYALGTTVSGTLTTTTCQLGENQYYDRYVITSATQQLFIVHASPMRNSLVFANGIRLDSQTDTIPYLTPAGTYSVRVQSSTSSATGSYTMQTRAPNLGKVTIGNAGVTCYRIQTPVGIVFQEELRCSGTNNQVTFPCGTGTTSMSSYRLHFRPGEGATIVVSSSTFDPCVSYGTPNNTAPNGIDQIAADDNSGGGTSARLRIDPAPVGRSFIVNVHARPPAPAFSLFTISIQP